MVKRPGGWVIAFMVSWSATAAMAQKNTDCYDCHNDKSMTMEKWGKEISLHVSPARYQNSAHSSLLCTNCHKSFDPEELPHVEPMPAVSCIGSCHADALKKHGFHKNILKSGGFSSARDVSCKGCHGAHYTEPISRPGARFQTANLTSGCGRCHESVRDKFMKSAHHEALSQNPKSAPTCLTCHLKDVVNVTAERDTAALKVAQEKMCLSCHLDDPDVKSRMASQVGFIAAYGNSVHGIELHLGNGKAANCVDCHGSHEMQHGYQPTSRVAKFHVPETCARCHADIATEFAGSIHATAVKKGNMDVPVCTDCHGEHNIMKHDNPKALVNPLNVSNKLCAACHTSLRLSERYGISSDRFSSFEDSYHGLAIRGGGVEVANCASCHGTHNIRASSDPTSTVHKSNLAVTCGKCHPGANQRFAVGSVHLIVNKSEEPILYWVGSIYVSMIVVVVGGMFLFNTFDFIKKSRVRYRVEHGLLPPEPSGYKTYLRMALSERIQHGAMALSFIVLVITGFMLKYPDAWWVVALRDLDPDIFELRNLVHRIAAVVMIAVCVYHVGYVAFTQRGRQLIKDLLLKRSDLMDAVKMAGYNLGIVKNKPELDRFSYIEKFEYWALIWGSIVMVVTGIILWFENTFIGLMTKLGWDVALAIHFYEAWLATLAIVVWHFYYVIFNPNVYPMSTAWFTGHLNEKEMLEEHPKELREIKRREQEGFDESGA